MCTAGTEQHYTKNTHSIQKETDKVKNVQTIFVGLRSRVEKNIRGKTKWKKKSTIFSANLTRGEALSIPETWHWECFFSTRSVSRVLRKEKPWVPQGTVAQRCIKPLLLSDLLWESNLPYLWLYLQAPTKRESFLLDLKVPER